MNLHLTCILLFLIKRHYFQLNVSHLSSCISPWGGAVGSAVRGGGVACGGGYRMAGGWRWEVRQSWSGLSVTGGSQQSWSII